MKLIARKYISSVVFFVIAMSLFLLGAFMLYQANDNGLFFEPQSAINLENAELLQKSHPDLKGVIHSIVNESLAEKARLQAIRKLWIDLGEFLLLLSVIQIGLVFVSLFLDRPSPPSADGC